MSNDRKYKRSRPKAPSEVFNQCLSCGSKELLRIEPDLQCMRCDWNTFAAHVDAGGFDSTEHLSHPILVSSQLNVIENHEIVLEEKLDSLGVA